MIGDAEMKNVHTIKILYPVIFALLFALFAGNHSGYTQTDASFRAYVISTSIAWMRNFSNYTHWSPESTNGNEIIISVFSLEDEAKAFINFLHGKKIKSGTPDEKTLVVRHVKSINDLSKSNIVYISQDWSENKKEIIEKANEWQALSFGFDKEFLDYGGLVQFLLSDKTVEFTVNLDIMRKNNIEIEPRVLRLAK